MNPFAQAFHIFVKDVRRYWPLVGLFVGILSVDAVVDASTPRFINGMLGTVMGGIGIRGAILGLLTVMVTALVVHEDDVSTGQSFWSSRPFSRMAMFGGKLLFVGVFLVLIPLAFQAYAITQLGTAYGLGRLLAESAVYQVSLVSLVMVLSAVTREIKATVILGVVGYVALGLIGSLLAVDPKVHLFQSGTFMLPGDLRASRAFAGKIWWIGAGLGLAGFQYVTGRTRLTFGGLGVALAVASGIAIHMPWDLTEPPREIVELAGAEAPEMRIDEMLFAPSIRGTRSGALDGVDAVIATGDTEYALAPRMGTVELAIERFGEVAVSNPPGRGYSPIQRYTPQLPGYRWLGAAGDWAQFDVRVLLAPPGTMDRELASIDAMEIRTTWDAYDRRIIGRLPLEVGAELTEGPERVRVESVEFGPTSVEVQVSSAWVTSALSNSPAGRGSRARFVMVNDARRELLTVSSGGNTTNRELLVLGGPKASRHKSDLRYRFESLPGSREPLDRAWFDDAHILVFVNDYVGTFEGTARALEPRTMSRAGSQFLSQPGTYPSVVTSEELRRTAEAVLRRQRGN